MTEQKALLVETYWTIEEPLNQECRLYVKGVPVRKCMMLPFGQNSRQEFFDFTCPVTRWKSGVIYRERFTLLPGRQIANVNLRVQMKITADGKILGEFADPNLINMQISGMLPFDTEFDPIIYQSEPGKCWTAEQLTKVTGGKWIVPPPKDWYVQSFSFPPNVNLNRPQPALLIPGRTSSKNSQDIILKNASRFAGAMVTQDVEGSPPNFPLLKVRNLSCAIWDIAVAARRRFQGRVIGVTGSAGKTTTCNMLEWILREDHDVTRITVYNVYRDIPYFFAAVNQENSYAVVEMSANSLVRGSGGSITYDITPDVAVITSIAPAHLGKYGSLKNLSEGKSRIFRGMSPGSYVVLNRDMPHYEIFEQKAHALNLNIITFGTHPEAFVRMPVLVDGGEFFVKGKTYTLSCPVPTEQLYDALAVVGVSVACGLRIEKTLEYLKTFEIVKGRGNILKSNRYGKNLKIIDSTVNANPDSIRYALQYLKTVEPNQKSRVAILGDIAELGKETINRHKGLAEAMLAAETDRLLLCGEFMQYPYEMLKDKINVTWFESLKELLNGFETHLRDGDTILVKSSHSTGLSKVVEVLSKNTPPHLTQSRTSLLNVPKPLFDIKDFVPNEITPELNGRMPADKLKRIHGDNFLYLDAARAYLSMTRAAERDKIFLNLVRAYRDIELQTKIFKARFTPVDEQTDLREGAVRVEFEGKLWELKPNQVYAAVPGTSSHSYGLAVDIGNAEDKTVKAWLTENAAQFGFVREYDFERWHFVYVKGRESVPPRVLEMENLPPEPTYTAEEIQRASGCKWLEPPPEGWTCKGILFTRPFKAGYLAAVDQGCGLGISEQLTGKIFRQMEGFICVNPAPLVKYNRPILLTDDLKDTIERLSAL